MGSFYLVLIQKNVKRKKLQYLFKIFFVDIEELLTTKGNRHTHIWKDWSMSLLSSHQVRVGSGTPPEGKEEDEDTISLHNGSLWYL